MLRCAGKNGQSEKLLKEGQNGTPPTAVSNSQWLLSKTSKSEVGKSCSSEVIDEVFSIVRLDRKGSGTEVESHGPV